MPGYAPPVIYEFADKRQLILWHPEAVNGLDPETGKVFDAPARAIGGGGHDHSHAAQGR